MNKRELIEALATGSGITKVAADRVVNTLTETITHELKRGGRVTIPGFGSFDVVHKKARKGRNPRTGQPINIKASTAPKFKPGKDLKEAVDKR